MKKRILQLSCFLTGYNYNLLEKCSEDSVMAVKRYSSGLWTILIMWLFIGFNFVSRYFKAGTTVSIIGALVLGCIILFLERFIILGHKQSRGIYYARVFIGCIMAFLGSMVLDQIVFKEDIAKQKQFLLGQEAEKVYQSRSIELNKLIKSLSDTKSKDSVKLAVATATFNARPTVMVKRAVSAVSQKLVQYIDTVNHKPRVMTRTTPVIVTVYVDSAVVNPIHNDIVALNAHMQKTEQLIQQHQNEQLSLKSSIEQELKQTTGFIDEQKALWTAVQESIIGKIAWALFFLFFASIELLIVMNKIAERKHMSDYETLVAHQKEMHEKKIRLLAEDENVKPKK